MRVLVTGGAGYIGSHTCIDLIANGHEPLVVDNFANSSPEALQRVGELVQRPVNNVECDIRDGDKLSDVFKEFRPQAVIHFAGLKAVGESAELPQDYYDVNVSGTIALLKAMMEADCGRIVFSSSATVYGIPEYLPFDEKHRCQPTNVYGRTKLMAEDIIRDWQTAHGDTSAAILRYFNPVGAHVSGRIGEDPNDIPNNLMPFVAQVAIGRRERLQVFGDDYETPDGTGVRDYIHVTDLAKAHIAALNLTTERTGAHVFNIGSGQGHSVLEMVKAFEKASGREIPYDVVARRTGDIATSLADPSKANDELSWRAGLGLDDMCRSAWNWQQQNPNGYDESEDPGA